MKQYRRENVPVDSLDSFLLELYSLHIIDWEEYCTVYYSVNNASYLARRVEARPPNYSDLL